MTDVFKRRAVRVGVCVLVLVPAMSGAQSPPAASSSGAVATQAADPDADLQIQVGEPDFALGVLPTTLRMPAGKLAFRMTHRFTYRLNDSSLGDFLRNGLGIDSSATVGLELRVGVAPGTQLVVHRTGSRNIQFLGQHQVVAQRESGAFSLDVLGAIEGRDNFSSDFSYVAGGVLSRRFGDGGAIYAHPLYVVNATPERPGSDNNTFVLGVGARIRLGASRVYLVGEFAPRVGGYDGGTSLVSVGIEKRAGGHMFQLNLSNGFGTTLAQVGHGGPAVTHWHLGFNLSRRFF